jgi:hypothetical protein
VLRLLSPCNPQFLFYCVFVCVRPCVCVLVPFACLVSTNLCFLWFLAQQLQVAANIAAVRSRLRTLRYSVDRQRRYIAYFMIDGLLQFQPQRDSVATVETIRRALVNFPDAGGRGLLLSCLQKVATKVRRRHGNRRIGRRTRAAHVRPSATRQLPAATVRGRDDDRDVVFLMAREALDVVFLRARGPRGLNCDVPPMQNRPVGVRDEAPEVIFLRARGPRGFKSHVPQCKIGPSVLQRTNQRWNFCWPAVLQEVSVT